MSASAGFGRCQRRERFHIREVTIGISSPNPGTTVSPSPDGKGLELKAQRTLPAKRDQSGRKLAYAVMVNEAGAVNPDEVAGSLGEVFNDEGTIFNYRFENL